MKILARSLRLASRAATSQWTYDRRVRWFALVNGRWVPMTALFKVLSSQAKCNTYCAKGALEVLGVQVHKVGLKRSRRLQHRISRRGFVI